MSAPKVRRRITIAPEPELSFSEQSASSMVGDSAELYLGPRTISGCVAEAALRPDGQIEVIVDLEVPPASGHVWFMDGFELRVGRACSG